MILGIDVGGTTVKFGVVSPNGEISNVKAFDTASWVASGFVQSLIEGIKEFRSAFPGIKGVGIGWPGLLSADRRNIILLPNIPAVKDLPIVNLLEEAFPGFPIKIENDAKCATIGELYFGNIKDLDNYLLVTLGTGVGSGAVINKKLFLGARGNGMEIGHMLLEDGRSLEQHIGIQHIIKYAEDRIAKEKPDSALVGLTLSPKAIYEAAQKGDRFAISVFEYVGEKLGENLVSVIRVLDINTILLSGGISGAFDIIAPKAVEVLKKYLPPYYTNELQIKPAFLNNQVGILGAAGLVMEDFQVAGDVLKK